jgi:Alkali metal cation/H+ antiporter Nha1 C terminus
LVQLIRKTVEGHLPANDEQSMRTFWTARSQTSEERESWRQLREELRNLCSVDPSQLKINQARILKVLREYYSGDLLTDAFFQDEIEDIEGSDPDENSKTPSSVKSSPHQSAPTGKQLTLNPFYPAILGQADEVSGLNMLESLITPSGKIDREEPHAKTEDKEVEQAAEEASSGPHVTFTEPPKILRNPGKRKDRAESEAHTHLKTPSRSQKGPAHAYQFGNTIIVEDEDGEVIKQYTLPSAVDAPLKKRLSRLQILLDRRWVSSLIGVGQKRPDYFPTE